MYRTTTLPIAKAYIVVQSDIASGVRMADLRVLCIYILWVDVSFSPILVARMVNVTVA